MRSPLANGPKTLNASVLYMKGEKSDAVSGSLFPAVTNNLEVGVFKNSYRRSRKTNVCELVRIGN